MEELFDDPVFAALLAFGGAALVVSAAQGKSLVPGLIPKNPAPPPGEVQVQTVAEDANYLAGFLVGVASVSAAWYAYNKVRPKVRKALTVEADRG